MSSCTAFTTMDLAAELSLAPPRKSLTKYLSTDRRAGDPHVKGDLVSRTPVRSASCSPLHGSSNPLDGAVLPRDHRTFSTPSGPGVSSISSSGPVMMQSAVWCRESPSAEKSVILRSSPVHSRWIFCRMISTRALTASTSPWANRFRVASSEMRIVCCELTGTLFCERPLHTSCGMSHPDRLAKLSRQAVNGSDMLGLAFAAGPLKVRQESMRCDDGAWSVRFVYEK